jgi:hypothetical protein
MQERAFELQSESEAEQAEHEPVDLGAVRARTLVAVGELDKPDFHEIAGRLRDGIEGAEGAGVEAAGHLPSLERPEATARLVRAFLERQALRQTPTSHRRWINPQHANSAVALTPAFALKQPFAKGRGHT